MPKSVPPPPGVVLLCVDLQPVFLNALPSADTLLRRCRLAVSAAAGLGLPIVFTEQLPQKLGATDAGLRALAGPRARTWGKSTFSALADDAIRESLQEDEIAHVLICGLETAVCVYQTALDALNQDLQVTLLSDALGGRRADDGAVSLQALRAAGAHVLPTETVFYSLLHDSSHPFFKAFTQLVKSHG